MQTWWNQCETSANAKWQHNQQLKHKLAVNGIIVKTIWKTDYAIGTPRFLNHWTFLWTLKLKMKDKGHLVIRHLIVRLQLRLEECSRAPLNKRTAVWSHNPALSHGPGGISPDPQFGKLVVLHKSWPSIHAFVECLKVVKVPHLSLSLLPPPSLSLMSPSLFSPTYFHWP